ncbi:hypothetical protein, conserved [Eimeria acervulina]|uniref:Uncharacterized protein n=1 Tax=Eimeria acervulina TaxID=5801 RepID=U6GD92_EIMAC|nr:hypothetical protein, conserved [Eimeria acervulina]CDI78236.1 hypothetical protein, conserved [Eimeria acervulina]
MPRVISSQSKMNMGVFFRTLQALAQRHLSDHVYRVLVTSPAFQRFAVVSSQRAEEVMKRVTHAALKATETARKAASSPKSNSSDK